MDFRLESVLKDVDHINSINNQKRLAKEKFHESIVIFYNGGRFTITKDFIAFASQVVSANMQYITDDNDIPVKLENANDFEKLVMSTYASAAEQYFNEYSVLVSNSRNVEDLLSL
jgi:hypothetical protein